jgi:single-strand DNA-binding protein
MKGYGVGRLVKTPELAKDQNGVNYCKFTLAENEYKNGQQTVTHFFDFIVWSTGAENIVKYAKKGELMYYEFSGKQSRWEEDGKKKSKVYFRLDKFQLLGKKESSD